MFNLQKQAKTDPNVAIHQSGQNQTKCLFPLLMSCEMWIGIQFSLLNNVRIIHSAINYDSCIVADLWVKRFVTTYIKQTTLAFVIHLLTKDESFWKYWLVISKTNLLRPVFKKKNNSTKITLCIHTKGWYFIGYFKWASSATLNPQAL